MPGARQNKVLSLAAHAVAIERAKQIAKLIGLVAEIDVFERSNAKAHVRARRVCFYLMDRHTDLTRHDIADLFETSADQVNTGLRKIVGNPEGEDLVKKSEAALHRLSG